MDSAIAKLEIAYRPTVSSTTPAVATTAAPNKTRTSHIGSGSRNHLTATATAAKRTAIPAQAPRRQHDHRRPARGATVIADSTTRAKIKAAQSYQEILLTVIVDIAFHAVPSRETSSSKSSGSIP